MQIEVLGGYYLNLKHLTPNEIAVLIMALRDFIDAEKSKDRVDTAKGMLNEIEAKE